MLSFNLKGSISRNNIDLFQTSKILLDRFLDIINIFKRIEDVNKIKLTLYEDNQLKMFERIKESNIHDKNHQFIDIDKISEIDIKNNENTNDKVDVKLLKYLNY
jgi:hypothetical protein